MFFQLSIADAHFRQPVGNQNTQSSVKAAMSSFCVTYFFKAAHSDKSHPTLSSKRSYLCITLLFTDSLLKVLIATSMQVSKNF